MMKFKSKKFLILIITLILFILIGCTIISDSFLFNNSKASVSDISNTASSYTNTDGIGAAWPGSTINNATGITYPLPDSDVNNNEYVDTTKLNKIIQAINNVIGDYKDNLALYYYNFDTKDQYSINEDVYYLTASLKKIPLAMQVLDKVQAGEFTLDTEIEYLESDFADGTGILQFEEVIGSRTIRELLELSMTESDNIAYNMMNRLCGYTLMEYINNMLGETAMIIEDDFTKLTAKHNFRILYNLYTNPNNNPYYSSIIENLKNTAFNDSINKYLPKDTVSHKIGSYFRSYHDSGIIFAKETYLLVVLTKDIGQLTDNPEFTEDEEERYLVDWGKGAFEFIAQISKCIYEIIQE